MFTLHPQLAGDCVEIGDLPLCRVLLAKDGRYPWLILVPRRESIREVYELSKEDQQQLSWETAALAEAMAGLFRADKMNIAALGNQVPQLHVHLIARYKTDAAWPGPVWGAMPPLPYDEAALQKRTSEVETLIRKLPCWGK